VIHVVHPTILGIISKDFGKHMMSTERSSTNSNEFECKKPCENYSGSTAATYFKLGKLQAIGEGGIRCHYPLNFV